MYRLFLTLGISLILTGCSLVKEPPYNLQFQLINDAGEGEANVKYVLIDEDGKEYRGTTDENGYTEIVYSDREMKVTMHIVDPTIEIVD